MLLAKKAPCRCLFTGAFNVITSYQNLIGEIFSEIIVKGLPLGQRFSRDKAVNALPS